LPARFARPLDASPLVRETIKMPFLITYCAKYRGEFYAVDAVSQKPAKCQPYVLSKTPVENFGQLPHVRQDDSVSVFRT
jgi:hypothetical protein